MILIGAGEGFVNEEIAILLSKTGIPIVRLSRINGIETTINSYDSRYKFIPGGNLSPEKAQILLSFLIMAHQSNTNLEIQKFIAT